MDTAAATAALSQRAIKAMDDDIDGYNPSLPQLVKAWQRFAGLIVDGIAGKATLRALWLRHRPTPEQVVAVALAATQWPDVTYQLGQGGYKFLPDPASPLAACDCSGFGAHCLGLSREAVGGWLGGLEWIESTALVADATGAKNLVRAVGLDHARPGDLIAYGDKGGNQGHVGVVVARGPKGQIITVDCSSSGDKAGSAIQRRDRTKLWKDNGAVICRPVWHPV